MGRDGRGLERRVPFLELDAPELALEGLLCPLESGGYLLRRHRQERLVGEPVDVRVVERVDQHPVISSELAESAPEGGGMQLCPVACGRTREVDRVEFPCPGAGRSEAKLAGRLD